MSGDATPRRLHPLIPIVALIKQIPGMVVPLAGAFAFAQSERMAVLIPVAGVVLALVLAFQILAWWRFTYTLLPHEMYIESGILSRNRRSIPWDRIQDVEIERGPLARIFGLAKVKLETGEVLQKKDIAKDYFAEGLTDWNGQLLQLTWVSHVGFIYDPATFEQKRQFNYGGEGWGLTHDGRRLIMSDGTANLRWIDPDSLQELSRFTVRDGGQTIPNLNELEYVKGSIYANVWMTDRIAVIAPDSGNVTGWIDLTNLRAPAARQGDVLNGIAYDAAADRLFVTGKLWPRLYEIRLRSR